MHGYVTRVALDSPPTFPPRACVLRRSFLQRRLVDVGQLVGSINATYQTILMHGSWSIVASLGTADLQPLGPFDAE